MELPRKFGKRLHHHVPSWMDAGNFFHLCWCVDRCQRLPLTSPSLATALLESARFYHAKGRWWLGIFLLMPDHLHALISLPPQEDMSRVVGDWKRWNSARYRVRWQEGYFDHRVREDERGEQLQNQADYLLDNPVRAGFCARPESWPWKIDHL